MIFVVLAALAVLFLACPSRVPAPSPRHPWPPASRWFLASAMLLLFSWPVVVLCVVGFVVLRRRRSRVRVAPFDDVAFADALDLLLIAASGGGSPAQAIADVSVVLQGPGSEAFVSAARRLEHGALFEDVLAELAAALGTRSTRAVAALQSSHRHGAALVPALTLASFELRTEIRRAGEIRARKIPVRLLFPLVLCALPAFALLTIVPLVLSSIADLSG